MFWYIIDALYFSKNNETGLSHIKKIREGQIIPNGISSLFDDEGNYQ